MKWLCLLAFAWNAAALAQTWEDHLATGRKALFAGNAAWAAQELEQALIKSRDAKPGDQARIRFYMGMAQSDLGLYGRAEASQREALMILEAQKPTDERALAVVTRELGSVLQNQGRYRDAETFHRRSLGLTEKRAGADPNEIARALNNLASALVQLNRQAEAQKLLARAHELLAKPNPKPDPDLVDLVNLNLAESYRRQGRLADARRLYQSAFVNLQKRAGPTDLYAAAARVGFGLVLLAQGSAEGEKLYRQGLAIQANRLGENHPIVKQYKDERARLQKK